MNFAFIRRGQAQQHPSQGGLTGAVQADEGDDLTAENRQVHVVQDLPPAGADGDVPDFHQRLRMGFRQGHSGSAFLPMAAAENVIL
jgi:hypothetical protein